MSPILRPAGWPPIIVAVGSSILASLMFAVLGLIGGPAFAQPSVHGSGSTFAYPVIEQWAAAYEKAGGQQISYEPIGSTAGIAEINSGLVDFAVTDAPLVDAQLLRDGLAQFPVTIGAIVPVVNLPLQPDESIRFIPQVLTDIFLGRVKRWNDAAISAINPESQLPNQPILVVFRSDGSGTTYNWTDYLSKSSEQWKAAVGTATNVAWPVGVGSKGNAGVAQSVAKVRGAIGFVEYDYASRNKLNVGLVRNRAGNFVLPDAMSMLAAVDGVDWQRQHDFYVSLNDAPSARAYPIIAASFVVLRRYGGDRAHRDETLAFFRWAFEHGQAIAAARHHLPLPQPLVDQIEQYWAEQVH
jgi:phosphate transport system substrate-binding protein